MGYLNHLIEFVMFSLLLIIILGEGLIVVVGVVTARRGSLLREAVRDVVMCVGVAVI